MKITTFNPMLITKDAAPVIRFLVPRRDRLPANTQLITEGLRYLEQTKI